jgi:hypothetical protein
MKVSKRRSIAAVMVCAALLSMVSFGCAPQQSESVPADETSSNDTAVKGEYDSYNPESEAEVTSGSAIEGSDEEQLQQERIAGGAAGGVVSQNLEPLEGVTDYSTGEYTPIYGIAGDIPSVAHGDTKGTACTTCHTADESGVGTQIPASHVDQNLSDEDCLTCHDL